MIATIWLPLRPDQVEALIRHHRHEAAHASTLPERAVHLNAADDLSRRLKDHAERTEASDERAA